MAIETRSYRARWIFPVDAEPIEGGTVEIQDGRIAAIHSKRTRRAEDLGNAALIPGLVNSHTHLEFSDLTEPLQPSPKAHGLQPKAHGLQPKAHGLQPVGFADWIRAVVAHRQNRVASTAACVAQGCRESVRSGTTLIGEIAIQDWSPEAFASGGSRAVVFRELLGLRPGQTSRQLAIALQHLEETEKSNIVGGLSPHAPYSVHPDLFDGLVQLAAEFQAPLAIHLAETRAELELLRQGTGELVAMLKDFGVWRDDAIPRGSRPLDYLRRLDKLDRALVIHGNYLADDEIDYVAGHSNLTLVYCPRTHAYFKHSEHPWQKLLDRGGGVALGTDSRASNPDLSLWRELTFEHSRCPEVDPRALLKLGTINGARALGFDRELGTLTVGKLADLAAISLPAGNDDDPYSLLFDTESRVTATMSAGRWRGDITDFGLRISD